MGPHHDVVFGGHGVIPKMDVFEGTASIAMNNGYITRWTGDGKWHVRVYDDHGGWRKHEGVWPKTWHPREALHVRAEA